MVKKTTQVLSLLIVCRQIAKLSQIIRHYMFYLFHYRRYMTEILTKRRKTLYNQSIYFIISVVLLILICQDFKDQILTFK